MKRSNFTFSKKRVIFTRVRNLVLFISLLIVSNPLKAQDFIMKFAQADTTSTSDTLTLCNGNISSSSIRFTDDGNNDGNYMDSHQRRDTVEICPLNRWHRVNVAFTDFDLEAGDSLVAFDGNKDAVRQSMAIAIGTGSGVGSSNAFGGFVSANCNPAINKLDV